MYPLEDHMFKISSMMGFKSNFLKVRTSISNNVDLKRSLETHWKTIELTKQYEEFNNQKNQRPLMHLTSKGKGMILHTRTTTNVSQNDDTRPPLLFCYQITHFSSLFPFHQIKFPTLTKRNWRTYNRNRRLTHHVHTG